MGVDIYYASVTGNLETKKAQQKIEMVLDSKKIPYTLIDITASASDKEKMRELSGNPKALPPQIFNDGQYCGDFEAFDDALESNQLNEFLKIN